GVALFARIQHLAVVERAFLSLLEGATTRPQEPADALAAAALLRETGERLVAHAWSADAGRLQTQLPVPWWEGRPFAVGDILGQVLSHSAQHRAEVCLVLLRAGFDTGELDYIVWVAGGEPGPGEPLRFPPS
ncbi:MAG: DinB family protein, partial [Dehalococcoidia bacterium]|nr:DinB family protein [Dehalococcoidia bacterium]